MALSQTHFQDAHHFEVRGGQFLNNIVINKTSNNDAGTLCVASQELSRFTPLVVSTTLWQHTASGAIFDSAERDPPGKCHPGTREKILKKIEGWIEIPDPSHRFLWLHGPVGSGKSAVAQTICERLSKAHQNRYGGSFFFAKGDTNRGNGFKLFATLSYQLALQSPSLRREINEALYGDPSLPTKSMEVQLFSLIIQPLLRCQPFPTHSPTVIIDGLDECADNPEMDVQRRIITLISESIIKHAIPIRFMIASRPESWIRDTFETPPLQDNTFFLSLRDDEDATKDIKAYLTEEFEKIRVEHKRIMGSVAPPWPPSHIVDGFVFGASTQYIYAKTILKFVGKSSRFSDPQEQLRILISSGPHRASAFSELDRLYGTILSVYPRWPTMKLVLGGILCGVNLSTIKIALGVEDSELIMALDALSSLVNIRRQKSLTEQELFLEPIFGPLFPCHDDVWFCHLSFRDFLMDKSRSGNFYVDIPAIIARITRAFFGIIHRNLDDNYAREPHVAL